MIVNMATLELPQVSVIIPAYNCERYVAQAVESVLQQTYPNIEIIVIDDGSKDNTRDVLEPYFDRIRYVYQDNQGVATARNHGIALAQGELIAFLDADDYFIAPEKTANQVACFQDHPSIGIVNSGFCLVDEHGHPIRDVEPWQYAPELDVETWLLKKPVLPSAMMFRKEWLDQVGGFDSRFAFGEDSHLLLRLVTSGCEARWLRQITVAYRQHRNNATQSSIRHVVQSNAANQDNFSRANLPETARKIEGRARYNHLVYLAWRLYHTGNYQEMEQYLYEAFTYAKLLPSQVLCDWIDRFTNHCKSSNYEFNIYSFCQSKEWRALTQTVLKTGLPKVSIIIPSYNNGDFIGEAIESILRQTYKKYEIIVVDDGSTDHTREALEPYFSQIRYIYQENQGASAARNRAIHLARGEFVAFLDADDYLLLDDKLEKQVAMMEADSSIGMVHSGWRLVTTNGEPLYEEELWKYFPELDLETWVLTRIVLPSAMLFRRDWLERINGFDTNLKRAVDVDLILRMARLGCKTAWHREVTVCYRQHNTSLTHNALQQAASFDVVMNKFFAQREQPEQIYRLENKARYRYLIWLAWRLCKFNEFEAMSQYLLQSLDCTLSGPVDTISNWIETFGYLFKGQNLTFDLSALNRSEAWRRCIDQARQHRIPRVSVVIPAYNSAQYIGEAIESVLNQTYQDYEIIVVDDGSTDNTQEALKPYSDRIRYVYHENQGVGVTRNRGIWLARGEFVAFLDADDYFLPNKLEEQVAFFDENPSLGLISGGWRLVTSNGEPISDRELWHGLPELNLEAWVLWRPVLPSAMMIRRDWLERVDGFNTKLSHAEDADLAIRLSLMGCESAWLKKIVTCYRLHGSGATGNVPKQAKLFQVVYDQLFSRADLPEKVRVLENKSRYNCLVWLAWRLYQGGYYCEMAETLQKALQYTTYSKTKTIDNWIELFTNFSKGQQYAFDAYKLNDLREWRQLIYAAG